MTHPRPQPDGSIEWQTTEGSMPLPTPDPDELDAAALEPRGTLPTIGAALAEQYRRARALQHPTHVDPVLALAVAAYLRAAGSCGPCSLDVALEASGRHTGDELNPSWPRHVLAQYVRQLDDRGRCGHSS